MKVAVLTRSYDNARTGSNTQETVLTPAQVSQHGMKKLFSLQLSGDAVGIEAQPLIVPDVTMADGSVHDVVYLASMANTVWAFDANSGAQLWPRPISLGTPIAGNKKLDLYQINDHWGILSTPVIDLDTKTMYVVNWSSPDGSVANAVHRLHAIDIVTGAARHPPLDIQGSFPQVGRPPVTFHSPGQKQRAALLLTRAPDVNGRFRKTLFMACGSVQETGINSHGWVLAFDLDSFSTTAAWCSTPADHGGGIWQGAQGPAADDQGNIYAMTGNGNWDGQSDFSESFVKLHYAAPQGGQPAGLAITDWWTPFTEKSDAKTGLNGRKHNQTNNRGYDWGDQDLGSGGPVVIQKFGLVVGAGKDGILYVLDQNKFGKTALADLLNPAQNYSKLKSPPIFFTYFPGFAVNPAPQDPTNLNAYFVDNKTHHLHGSPVFWDGPDHGPMLFCWGENESLRAWSVNNSGKLTYVAIGHEVASKGAAGPQGHGGMPGGMLCLSANGNQAGTGIVWALAPLNGDANSQRVQGILRAYDAANYDTDAQGNKFLRLLWSSGPQNTFKHNKFNPPVVANGKVYVPTYDDRVDVYGLNAP